MNCIKPGLFITFEGGDGAGKSTQVRLLADYLLEQGHDVLVTREPGGHPNAEAVRELILKPRDIAFEPLSELMLFNAARHEHVEHIIKPALAIGKTVICDRFIDSTVAYQVYGSGLNRQVVDEMNLLATGGLLPDKTFILDIDPSVAAKRRFDRLDDAIELKGLFFQQKLREGFLELAKCEPQRFAVIDAAQPVGDVIRHIVMNSICLSTEI